MPYRIWVLSATPQWWESRLYLQPKQILDLATLGGMQGWVDLRYVKANRPGIKPATCKSQVQRPTTKPPRNTVIGHQFITLTVYSCVQYGGREARPRRAGLSAAAETCIRRIKYFWLCYLHCHTSLCSTSLIKWTSALLCRVLFLRQYRRCYRSGRLHWSGAGWERSFSPVDMHLNYCNIFELWVVDILCTDNDTQI